MNGPRTAKLSITTACSAHCATCPVWRHSAEHMRYQDFVTIWDKLSASVYLDKIILNSTGDMFNHPERNRIFDYIESHKGKFVVMQTNAHKMDRVPKIDQVVISFNGGTREAYERTTGLPFDDVVATIRRHYDDLAMLRAEIHCLMWEGNAGTEDALAELWADFPGRVRVSYKYDNQLAEDRTLPEYRRDERIECDYLEMLIVMPSGRLVCCAHDFEQTTDWGNLLRMTVRQALEHPARIDKQVEHLRGDWTGLCRLCNYNTSAEGKVRYLKETADVGVA